MPYSGPSDPDLPDDVAARPADERRAFVSTFNSVLEKCEEEGGDDCESRAHAIGRNAANTVRDAGKVGRQLSQVSREAIRAAIDALTALLAGASEREDALIQAREAVGQLMDGELIDEFIMEPQKAVTTLTDTLEQTAQDAAMKFDIESPCGHKAIKIINSATRRVGGYLTVWGELDCDNERMTRDAIEPYVGKVVPVMFWKHGLDADFGTTPVGAWDGKSLRTDDLGLYGEGNIGRDAAGEKAWGQIETAGSYGFSVGSQWYLVKRRKLDDGTVEIIDWPLLDASIMEGGAQCVPSAQRVMKGDLRNRMMKIAVKAGVEWREGKTIRIGDKTMTVETTELNVDELVAQQVAAALKAKDRAAEKARLAEEQRRADIAAKATEAAETMIAAKKEEWEAALLEQWETEQAEKAEKAEKAKTAGKTRSPVPANHAVPGTDPLPIAVFSPYDRLSTMDLCLRYELMRSYGKRPSTKFWRALAGRAAKMARAEDTLYVRNGQPVKVPALDWNALAPKNLDFEEVDGELFGVKAGQMDRYMSGGFDRSDDNVTPLGLKQLAEIAVKANEVVYSTQANAGDEWVPTLMTAELWRTVRLNAAVLGLFDQFDMPSQPYDYPVESTDPTFYKVSETTNEAQLILTGGPFTDSKPGTAKKTFSASKLGAISYWSEEMEEDSIIAVEPQFRDQYGVKMAHAIDEVLISGDETTGTANISYEGSTITSSSRFLTVDGLRHEPLVTTTADSRDGGALTINDFTATQKLMGTGGKFGVNPANLAIVCDTATYLTALLLGEVVTADKFGAQATVLTGQLGALLGIPIIASEDYGLTDATGRIDETAGDNVKGQFMVINRRGVLVGWRRRPRIRVVGLPGAEARYIVGSARLDIQFREAGMVAMSYNLTV